MVRSYLLYGMAEREECGDDDAGARPVGKIEVLVEPAVGGSYCFSGHEGVRAPIRSSDQDFVPKLDEVATNFCRYRELVGSLSPQ